MTNPALADAIDLENEIVGRSIGLLGFYAVVLGFRLNPGLRSAGQEILIEFSSYRNSF
jgi:hypothetical protein